MNDKTPPATTPETPEAKYHDAESFRRAGHRLVDDIADFFLSLPQRPVRRELALDEVRELIGDGGLPDQGVPIESLLETAAPMLFDNSLHNGHPKFFGYITASAAPLGGLADLLAASINANVALWDLSPVASEIEAQTIRWLAELVGYEPDCGGLMVSGGNMANILAFLAARRAKTNSEIRTEGLRNDVQRLTVYCASETHTWIQKATDVSGLGTDSIRWIETDDDQRMNVDHLRLQLEDDLGTGCKPFMVVATAGTVSTGAVDPLIAIHRVARDFDLWFHVDGAYGGPAAALPEADDELKALTLADSVALDPHKWLYAPLEAACTLVRERRFLVDAFTYRPPYYRFDDDGDASGNDYYSLGLQNSRGFRALKVWLALRHCGRNGYVELIRNDIDLARQLHEQARRHERLEALTQNLSITTFRFIPEGLDHDAAARESYLNELNAAIVERLQAGGEIYLSNAIVNGRYALRACLVNFRTTTADIAEVPDIVARVGAELDTELRPENLR